MTVGAVIFMALSWGFVLALVFYCLSHFFRKSGD